jgi:hypothetical protein
LPLKQGISPVFAQVRSQAQKLAKLKSGAEITLIADLAMRQHVKAAGRPGLQSVSPNRGGGNADVVALTTDQE